MFAVETFFKEIRWFKCITLCHSCKPLNVWEKIRLQLILWHFLIKSLVSNKVLFLGLRISVLLHRHVVKIICKTAVMNGTGLFSMTVSENTKSCCFSKFPFPCPCPCSCPCLFPFFSFSPPPFLLLFFLSKEKFSAPQDKIQPHTSVGGTNKAWAVMPCLLTRRLQSGLEATNVQLLESPAGESPGGHTCECVKGAELPSHTTGMPSEGCALWKRRKINLFGASLRKPRHSITAKALKRAQFVTLTWNY